MSVRIQMRRDTSANWTTNNPTLAAGEMGLETDTGRWKIGNGNDAWTALSYANSVFSGQSVISDNSAGNALRITQTGSGNALVVEDSANPDSTPFVIDASGNVRIASLSTAGVVTNSASGDLSTTTSPNLNQLIIGALSTVTPVTAATYTVSSTDMSIIFNTTATCTVTLPTATVGRVLLVKTIAAFAINSASSNVLPINSGTAATSILSATAGKWAILVGNGTNWVIMASN